MKYFFVRSNHRLKSDVRNKATVTRHIVCFGHVMVIPFSDWRKSVITREGDYTLVITLFVSGPIKLLTTKPVSP